MQTSKKSSNGQRLIPLMAIIMLISMGLVVQIGAAPTRDYPTKMNLSKLVPYHPIAGGDTDLTGEACLSMVFDYWGPYIQQQDIRNVTKGRFESGIADSKELVRAAHFSDQSFYTVNQRGYKERAVGYGGFQYDWTDYERAPSPRFESRFTDLYNSLSRGHVVMAYMYLDIPPEITTPTPPPIPDPNNPQPPQPPDPQVTPEDLAALEKVWRVVVGYDLNTRQIILHDPLPAGTGFKGGREVRMSIDNFDMLWNVYQLEDGTISNHRYGVSAAPWSLKELDHPKNVEAGTSFEISANITYFSPTGMEGALVEDPAAVLNIPADFSVEEGSQSIPLNIGGTGSFTEVTWKVKAPDTTYSGQDQRFWINASGIATVSDPAHRDAIGGGVRFEVEAFGFLNHPPTINAAMIDPPNIPDDGSIQPLITCTPYDEDGNLIQVTVDLSDVGGSPVQRLYDNGNYGDVIDDDGIYTYQITRELPVGVWTFKLTAKDSKAGYAYANVTVKVDPISEFTEAPDFEEAGVTPKGVPNDGITTGTIWAIVTDEENDVERVVADLSPLGGDNKQRMYDDGSNGDLFSNDDNYSFSFTVNPLTLMDSYQIEITAFDTTDHESLERVWIDVILPPVAPVITAVSPNPEEVPNDGETEVTLTAIVEDGNEDVVEVYVNLAPLKGPSTLMLKDDGVSPDARKGDDMWTVQFTIPSSVSSGIKGKIDVTARDSTNLQTTESFSLEVIKTNQEPTIVDFKPSDQSVGPGDEITVWANVSDPDLDTLQVELILTELNINNVAMTDDGEAPDESAGDLRFTGAFKVPESAGDGNYNVTIRVTDGNGGEYESLFVVAVSSGSAEGEEKSAEIPVYVYIGVPGVFGFLLLILIVVYFNRKKAPQSPMPPGRPGPMPPHMQRAPPIMRPMR